MFGSSGPAEEATAEKYGDNARASGLQHAYLSGRGRPTGRCGARVEGAWRRSGPRELVDLQGLWQGEKEVVGGGRAVVAPGQGRVTAENGGGRRVTVAEGGERGA